MFYGLTNIVYPVIKEAFNNKCPDPVLQEICMEIYRANKQPSAKTYDDDDNSRKKRIYLTQLQKQQLFSANGKIIFINTQFRFFALFFFYALQGYNTSYTAFSNRNRSYYMFKHTATWLNKTLVIRLLNLIQETAKKN